MNILQTVLQGLQRVPNTAARLLTGSGRLESALPLMRGLYWLPVSSRIRYKLWTLMSCMVPRLATSEICVVRVEIGFSRGLRRSIQSTFHDAEVLLFSGPRARNSLPSNVCAAPSRTVFANRLKRISWNLHILEMHWCFCYFVSAADPRRGAPSKYRLIDWLIDCKMRTPTFNLDLLKSVNSNWTTSIYCENNFIWSHTVLVLIVLEYDTYVTFTNAFRKS